MSEVCDEFCDECPVLERRGRCRSRPIMVWYYGKMKSAEKKSFILLSGEGIRFMKVLFCYGESAVPNIKIVDGGKCKNKEN